MQSQAFLLFIPSACMHVSAVKIVLLIISTQHYNITAKISNILFHGNIAMVKLMDQMVRKMIKPEAKTHMKTKTWGEIRISINVPGNCYNFLEYMY